MKEKNILQFSVNLFYIFLVFIWGFSVSLIYHIENGAPVPFVLYLLCFSFLVSSITSYVVHSYRVIEKIVKPLVSIAFFSFFVLNQFCFINFSCPITPDVLDIAAQTNVDEVKEFFQTYMSFSTTILFMIDFFTSWVLYNLSKRHYINNYYVKWSFFLGTVISLVACWHNPAIIKSQWGDTIWRFHFDETIDLKKHYQNPSVSFDRERLPEKIVMIIGESHNRNHNSLYGYCKNTNPCLSQLKESGNLFVFENVTSPASFTTKCFKYLLNSYCLADSSESRWYDSVSLIEVLRLCGYSSIWISNQKSEGLFDNVPAAFAKICDGVYFNDGLSTRYDEYLTGFQHLIKENEKQLFIFHMMGQHERFEERYPDDFKYFSENDYKDVPQNQISTLMNYDNATIYNDYVVGQLIKRFDSEDSFFIYCPDHGLDLYQSDSNFAGHSRLEDPKSQEYGCQIPLYMVLSDSCLAIHKNIPNTINQVSQSGFCTDSLYYIILRILEIAVDKEL